MSLFITLELLLHERLIIKRQEKRGPIKVPDLGFCRVRLKAVQLPQLVLWIFHPVVQLNSPLGLPLGRRLQMLLEPH